MSKPEVLVIEDEEDILHLLFFNLNNAGYSVRVAEDGKKALKEVKKSSPDLILLDLMLPKMSGLDVCRTLKSKKKTRDIPIIMVTAKGGETDVVKGLEAGADDYVTKPFSPKVLLARINAVLRRKQQSSPEDELVVSHGEITFQLNEHKAYLGKQALQLTPMEYQFLLLLAKKPGWVFTRNQIVDAIRGEDYAVTQRSVDVLVVGLRKKLRKADENGACYIETVRGVGYRLKHEGLMLND
ncbi:MAG: DNA-binding response regulator [Acidobacteria bacterium]|nr:MAG: DNA-binding response regulator [Acidobacteriota bacterium]PIE89190.1 MAG: DNA-binding response regulator [Acidobacteriota bacterium]